MEAMAGRSPFRGLGPAQSLPAAIAALVFLETLLFGANRTDLALAFSCLWFLALCVVMMGGRARRALDQLDLRWAGGAFAAVIAAGVLSLTPWAIGGANRVWLWVPGVPAIGAIAPYASLVEIVKLLALGSAFLVGAVIGAQDDKAGSLIGWLRFFGLAYGLWAFWDHAVSPTLLFGEARPFDPSRLSASFGSANTAATLFGALVILNVASLMRIFRRQGPGGFRIGHLDRAAPEIAFAAVGLASAAACLVLTLSRTGLAATIGVCVAVVWTLAARGSGRTPWTLTGLLLAIVALTAIGLNFVSLQQRFAFWRTDSQLRATIAAAHWHAFTLAPWSGYGLGSFSRVNAMIMNSANLDALRTLGAAHNVYIQWLEQGGLIGALAMWACLGALALQTALGAARYRPVKAWPVAALAVLMLFLIHGANDFAFEVPSAAAFLSLVLGCGFGASRPRAPSPPTPAGPQRR